MKYETVIRKNFTVSQVSGSEFLVMCPWHADTSQGHCYINGWRGVYLCMSCGQKGHLDNIGIDLPQVSTDDVRERLRQARTKGQGGMKQHYYPEGWLDQFDNDHPYWTVERELPEEIVQALRLGYDPFTNRMTIPLRDDRNRILGVTNRRLDDGKPKYLHPKGFPTGRHLYAAWLLTDERKVALTEGQMDAARGWASRVPALALMGARITKDQVKVLQRNGIESVVLMMDNDGAGVQGTMDVYESLRGTGIRVQAGWYRPYWNVKDPDGLNPQRYRKMFHSALTIIEWASHV